MNKVYQKIFLYGINASYLLYFVALFGIGGFAPQYLELLQSFLKYYIAILLIALYNPITYRERKFGEFDRDLVFTSGVFLLLSTTAVKGIEEYIKHKSQHMLTQGLNFRI